MILESAFYPIIDIQGFLSVKSLCCQSRLFNLDLIYDQKNRDSLALKENAEFTLRSINVNVSSVQVSVPKDYSRGRYSEERGIQNMRDTDDTPDTENVTIVPFTTDISVYDSVIICTPFISSFGMDTQKLAEWCENGGDLMLAGGIDESEDLSGWNALIGAEPTDELATCTADSLQFNTDILAGVKGREFSDDVISEEVPDFDLTENCLVHVSTSDEKSVPLLWEQKYGKGTVVVCSADILKDKNDRGLLAAAYCLFFHAYAYPVINGCVYCIDDFPSPAPAGYDENVLKQYGYTVSDFYCNVCMPAMQEIAEKYDIKFSTFSIETYENNVDGPFDNTDNKRTASYYASLILNMVISSSGCQAI